tara:strand:- start:293 stop:394 length:102 start_codon:yes stop_codon:yes gene_type:complete
VRNGVEIKNEGKFIRACGKETGLHEKDKEGKRG